MTGTGTHRASATPVAVVGAGITGLAAAHHLANRHPVTLFEATDSVGGRIASSPFAGVDGIDEGADAFLARIPDAVDLASAVGLADDLVHPEPVSAAVWHHGLHPIPDGLLLGVPRQIRPLVRSGLLTRRGTARAAIEPLLPRRSVDHDSIGRLIRERFGDEVHDRIVDALVGSIYATDTDRSSLAEVPQLAALSGSRSLYLAARRQAVAATATSASAPLFAAPRTGVAGLARATRQAVIAAGARVETSAEVGGIEPADGGWAIDGRRFGAVILATPAHAAARVLDNTAPDAASALRAAETADVAMVTLHVADDQWPEPLRGLSGYLVPKSVQRSVTAASFGSQKWAHWAPPTGGQILRVSLGRDGLPVLHRTDDELLAATIDEMGRHLGVRFDPLEVRITRWPAAFPQYRPHHAAWRAGVEAALPPGVFVAGAPYRGVGIPACVRDGVRAGHATAAFVSDLTDSTT